MQNFSYVRFPDKLKERSRVRIWVWVPGGSQSQLSLWPAEIEHPAVPTRHTMGLKELIILLLPAPSSPAFGCSTQLPATSFRRSAELLGSRIEWIWQRQAQTFLAVFLIESLFPHLLFKRACFASAVVSLLSVDCGVLVGTQLVFNSGCCCLLLCRASTLANFNKLLPLGMA